MAQCSVDKCEKPSRAWGMCRPHYTKEYRKQDYVKNIRKQEYSKAKDSIIEKSSKRYHEQLKNDPAYKEARRLYSKEWREANKEKHALQISKWVNKNRDRRASQEAQRRFAKRLASPKWLSENQIEDIYAVYKLGKEENKEVDHILPLVSNDVCGLHVSWNLQLLKKCENASKSNKFDGTYKNDSWRLP